MGNCIRHGECFGTMDQSVSLECTQKKNKNSNILKVTEVYDSLGNSVLPLPSPTMESGSRPRRPTVSLPGESFHPHHTQSPSL